MALAVSSPDKIVRTHPAAYLKNRVWTRLLGKLGPIIDTNQIDQGSELCLTSITDSQLAYFWPPRLTLLVTGNAINTNNC